MTDIKRRLKEIVGPRGYAVGREPVAALPSIGLVTGAKLTLRKPARGGLARRENTGEDASGRGSGVSAAAGCLWLSGEHAIGLEKRDFLHYCRTEIESEVMRQLKSLFDPKGILNAGKVL